MTTGQVRVGVGSSSCSPTRSCCRCSLSCNSLRHLVGGRLDCFTCSVAHRVRDRALARLTVLNDRHMEWAWISLVSVALADLYVRPSRPAAIDDPRIL